jgi:DNA-binding CsgD family transcriptional regulator
MMVHNAPPAFVEDATRNGDDARRDPVLQRLKRDWLPFAYRQDDDVDAGAARPKLTGHELEVLRWAAAGKTAGEIAQILSVSTWTVTFHMRRVLEKLHAVNKHTAVAQAMSLGLL